MTVQITDIHAYPGVSGFFFDDQAAIVAGVESDGFGYNGTPRTAGFEQIREPGEALLIDLELSNGQTVRGDCAAVQYSGAGGRDPLFRAEEYVQPVEDEIGPQLIGRAATAYAENEQVLTNSRLDGTPLHTALQYGLSGALLSAAATVERRPEATVIADTVGTTMADRPVPVFGQTGEDRRRGAEKMIRKGVDVLPHGLFNSLRKVGDEGQQLRSYLAWLADRTDELGAPGYEPRFHVDIYGMLGKLFEPPYDRPAVIEYVQRLSEAAAPYQLQLEGPIKADSRAEQIRVLSELRDGLAAEDVPVEIVADEWCDQLSDIKAFVDAGAADLVQVKTPDLGIVGDSARAVQYTQGTNVDAYLGGTCNETDRTARISAQIALGTDARQVLAKPGMGFDEGYMIITNEMRRALAATQRKETVVN